MRVRPVKAARGEGKNELTYSLALGIAGLSGAASCVALS